jgi:hypothetical protein
LTFTYYQRILAAFGERKGVVFTYTTFPRGLLLRRLPQT